MIHANRTGLAPNPPSWKGKKGYEHNKSKEVHQYCGKTFKYIKSFGSCKEAERTMGYKFTRIHRAIKTGNRTRDGYYYSYYLSPHFELI